MRFVDKCALFVVFLQNKFFLSICGAFSDTEGLGAVEVSELFKGLGAVCNRVSELLGTDKISMLDTRGALVAVSFLLPVIVFHDTHVSRHRLYTKFDSFLDPTKPTQNA